MRIEIVDGRTRPAYVDADWVVDGADPRAALVVTGAANAAAADRAAGLALLALAARAAAEVGAIGHGPVEVTGEGFVAGAVAAIVGAHMPTNGARPAADGGGPPAADGGDRDRDARPAAIVDTTGDPGRIRDALARLEDLGTLVLAGETGDRPLELDLYPDVHVRGLRIVGVSLDTDVPRERDLPAAGIAYLEGTPVAPAGGAAPAAWYRLG
jgi:threonine dehydrogenase-like Zn-dependent dehydrogenase